MGGKNPPIFDKTRKKEEDFHLNPHQTKKGGAPESLALAPDLRTMQALLQKKPL